MSDADDAYKEALRLIAEAKESSSYTLDFSALGNDLLAWLVAQSETISVLAPAWGTAFEAWITPVMMRAREANIATRALLKRPE